MLSECKNGLDGATERIFLRASMGAHYQTHFLHTAPAVDELEVGIIIMNTAAVQKFICSKNIFRLKLL